MKKIVTYLGVVFLSLGANAQESGLEIYVEGGDVDVSGTTVELDASDESMHQVFDVKNVSGTTLNLRVERAKITELAGTQDYLCWGANPESGACYSKDLVSPEDPFITPDASDLLADSIGWLATYHVTNGFSGCAQYRYYVIDEGGARLDSVDVLYCSTVSIEEDVKVDVSVYPNPASGVVNIAMENNVNNVSFRLYNVLGDVVLSKQLNAGQNTINVEKLPNGIYFYSVLKEGSVVETKKLVVRH